MAELREFRDDADAVEIGAALTLTEIAERWVNAPADFSGMDWVVCFSADSEPGHAGRESGDGVSDWGRGADAVGAGCVGSRLRRWMASAWFR